MRGDNVENQNRQPQEQSDGDSRKTIVKVRETVLEKVRPVESVQEWWEEHDDFESRTRGVEHYSWAEIARR